MLGWSLKINSKENKRIATRQIIFVVAIFLFSLFVFGDLAHAQASQETRDALGLTQVEQVTSLGKEDIRLTIAKIIRIVLGLLGIIVLSLMLYAGYTIMTSAGESDKVERGKKIILNATVGLLIILSAFAIVQFFIGKLGEATGFRSGVGGQAQRQTFIGSGSLGSVVRDHYPFRDQRDVPRNTRISVTFNIAFNPNSVFDDSNMSGVLGDCVDTNLSSFDWNADCDHVDTNAIQIYELDANGDKTGSPLDMVALASDEGGSFYTVVLRPTAPLGNDRDSVGYSVDLTNNIEKESGGGMFAGRRENHYEWQFYTGTIFDFSPPVVTGVYPKTINPTDKFPRNTVLQINFNEPMDPTVTQGRAGTFSHIVVNNMESGAAAITGNWRIANGYMTVEFVSDQQCGENSCGEPMYCLPITCTTANCSETHNALVRTANLISVSSWEALPFTGVTDMAGNALDGNRDNIQNNAPSPKGGANILSGESVPDNYIWNFEVENKIDRSAPYIRTVEPKLDEEFVLGDAVNYIEFSKPMWSWTLGGIQVTEKIGTNDVSDLWYRVSSVTDPTSNTSTVYIGHRIFGPNGEDAYYFTSVSSTVKALNQNCVYPGRGPYLSGPPGVSPECKCVEDVNGVLDCNILGSNCVPVSAADPNNDTGCVQTSSPTDITKPDIATCLSKLNEDNLSPLSPRP